MKGESEIVWFQDSGEITLPNQKKEETNSGIVLFILPPVVERFVIGWCYKLETINSFFEQATKEGSITFEGGTYYLAEKPSIEIKRGIFGTEDRCQYDKVYYINLHLFRILENES